jgi:biopolymer transport protein ExbD
MAISYEDSNIDSEGDPDAMLSEINTTPLVDVMLVLLIIFLITVPVINTSVVVRLPKQANQLQQTQANTLLISVDAAGSIYWFDSRLSNLQTLHERLRQAAAQQPQPEVHIRGDARADFEAVARVLQAAQAAGIVRVGFVTEPPKVP